MAIVTKKAWTTPGGTLNLLSEREIPSSTKDTASRFEAVNFAKTAGKCSACVPPPKKAVLSWSFATPSTEGGRLDGGFSF